MCIMYVCKHFVQSIFRQKLSLLTHYQDQDLFQCHVTVLCTNRQYTFLIVEQMLEFCLLPITVLYTIGQEAFSSCSLLCSNWSKNVYGQFGQSSMHHTFNFCPRPVSKDSNVQHLKSSQEVTFLIFIYCAAHGERWPS